MSEQKLREALERIELCLSQGDQSGAQRIVSEALADSDGQRDSSAAAWVDAFDAINAGNQSTAAPPTRAKAAPQEWQLVPVVMPDSMVAVMQRARYDGWDLHGMWAGLLAAAPEPTP